MFVFCSLWFSFLLLMTLVTSKVKKNISMILVFHCDHSAPHEALATAPTFSKIQKETEEILAWVLITGFPRHAPTPGINWSKWEGD